MNSLKIFAITIGSLTLLNLGILQNAQGQANLPHCAGPAFDAQGVIHLKSSNTQTEVFVLGQVEHLLPDDTKGLPHQKFMILVGNVPVEIVHDTAIAPRVPIQPGDTVSVCGEFIPVGPVHGLIHWTHHDPQGTHVGGFISARGQIYQ